MVIAEALADLSKMKRTHPAYKVGEKVARMIGKFQSTDVVPELGIECPACQAPKGEWCMESGQPGMHGGRITAWVWSPGGWK